MTSRHKQTSSKTSSTRSRKISGFFFISHIIFSCLCLSGCVEAVLNERQQETIPITGNNPAADPDIEIFEENPDYNSPATPSTEGSSTTAGNPGLDIPQPTINQMVISAPDASDVAVVQAKSGFDSAFGLVAVNTNAVARLNAKNAERSLLAKLLDLPSSFKNFFQTATAQATACFQNQAGYTPLTINANGGLDAQALPDTEMGDQIEFRYYDPATCIVGDAEIDTPNAHLVYLAQAAAGTSSITSDGASIYQIDANGVIVKLDYDVSEQRFYVSSGDFDSEFVFGEYGESAESLAYNTDNASFNILNDTNIAARTAPPSGVDLGNLDQALYSNYECFDGTGECNSDYIQIQSGCTPSVFEIYSGKIYFGVECDQTAMQEFGYIYELYNSTAGTLPSFVQHINYFVKTHLFFLTFDSNSGLLENFIFFEDSNNSLRLATKYNSSQAPWVYYDNLPITQAIDFTVIEPQAINGTIDGKAILLHDQGLSFTGYNLFCYGRTSNCSTHPKHFTIESTIPITSPIAMSQNTDLTLSYVLSNGGDPLNATDDFITVIDITNEIQDTVAHPTLYADSGTDGIIYLSQFFDAKTLEDFSPNGIHYFVDTNGAPHLMVSSSAYESAIIIDL